MNWDHFSYKVAAHFLSAMINGDYSGMTSEECAQYRHFERTAFDNARAAGFIVGHWATVDDSGDDWGTCAVTGLLAMREEVHLMVYRVITPAWRTTPAGTHICAVDGADVGHVWRASSGRVAAHYWPDGGPEKIRYFEVGAPLSVGVEWINARVQGGAA